MSGRPIGGRLVDRQPGSRNCSRARRRTWIRTSPRAPAAGAPATGRRPSRPGSRSASSRSRSARSPGTRLLKQADTAAGGTKKAEQILSSAASRPRRRERARAVEDRRRSPTRRSAPTVADVVAHRLGAAAGAARALAARAGERRPGLEGPPLGARAVRDPRRRGQGGQEGRSRSSTPSPASRRAHAGLHRGRVRLRERDARAERHDEQGLPAGRVLVAAGDARRSCSSRSARSSRPGCRCCSPSRACSRRSACRRSRAMSSRPATRRSR